MFESRKGMLAGRQQLGCRGDVTIFNPHVLCNSRQSEYQGRSDHQIGSNDNFW
jgi:hypothetical protein